MSVPGEMSFSHDGETVTASIGPDGVWIASRQDYMDELASNFPVIPTEAGTPWIQAFWRAARVLQANITSTPRPSPYTRGEESNI